MLNNLEFKNLNVLPLIYYPSDINDKYVIKPTDFHGLTPKLTVKIGDKVKAGTVLFFDKSNEKVKFCSPVSGEIIDIRKSLFFR